MNNEAITTKGRHVNYKKGEDEGGQDEANRVLGVKSPGVVGGGNHRSHRQHHKTSNDEDDEEEEEERMYLSTMSTKVLN